MDASQIDPKHGYCQGMTDALKRLREGARRAPTDEDRPPPSTFPMTPAARAAMRCRKESLVRV